ncbi:SDR family oxidoreductase [Nocardia sp. NPDC101769]|uniref:SDR family oxidoreductase n=1 Tax=Nocardia sp. NPDC101769 TaxID=3364333 RepID=UPI0037F5379E
MHVFVTGATGFIGSAVVAELQAADHTVVCLARSDASAAALEVVGAEVLRGGLEDLDSVRAGARIADGVVHLAFDHTFSDYAAAVQTDADVIGALGSELRRSERPLVIASGTIGLTIGSVSTEAAVADRALMPRAAGEQAALATAQHGVRASVVRLAPVVHSEVKRGFVGRLVDIARIQGISGYVGDGSQRWPAVHRLDAAALFRCALEQAPAGSVWHGVADEGVPIRVIAEMIGERLNLPVESVPAAAAFDHFGWLAGVLSLDSPASSSLTRRLLGWQPTHPGLLGDLDHGRYFENSETN